MKTRTSTKFLLLLLCLSPMLIPFVSIVRAQDLSITYTQHPILFIHGNGGSQNAWGNIMTFFTFEGWPSSLLYSKTLDNPSDTTIQGIIADSQQIEGWVNEILNETGSDKVDLISHSMGAASTRLYVKNLTGINNVDDYVALAGFSHGWDVIWVSQQPWYIPDTYIGESNCSLNIFLNNGDETPGGILPDTIGPRLGALSGVIFNSTHISGNINYTSIYSPYDSVSTPINTSILNGANNIEVPLISHVNFLYLEVIYYLTRDAVYDSSISYRPDDGNEGVEGVIPGFDIFLVLTIISFISIVIVKKMKIFD